MKSSMNYAIDFKVTKQIYSINLQQLTHLQANKFQSSINATNIFGFFPLVGVEQMGSYNITCVKSDGLFIINHMSEIIDTYQEDLVENIKQASNKIEGKFESKQDWKEMRGLLTECEKGIKLIQTELVGQPGPLRASKTARLREHKRKVDHLKRQTFNDENNWELQAGKNLLMGNRTTSAQVINNYDRSTEATERLRQSVKVMYENLEISENVGSELTNQTSKLIGSKKKVEEIRHDLGRSERKIKSMMLRVKKNKFILGGVIVFILVVLIIVLTSYFK